MTDLLLHPKMLNIKVFTIFLVFLISNLVLLGQSEMKITTTMRGTQVRSVDTLYIIQDSIKGNKIEYNDEGYMKLYHHVKSKTMEVSTVYFKSRDGFMKIDKILFHFRLLLSH